MGMSTHVVGFRPPDERFKKLMKIYQLCREAGEVPPQGVMDFFNDEDPDPRGVQVNLEKSGCLKGWRGESGDQGYEVDLTKLPKDVTVLRFYNSW